MVSIDNWRTKSFLKGHQWIYTHVTHSGRCLIMCLASRLWTETGRKSEHFLEKWICPLSTFAGSDMMLGMFSASFYWLSKYIHWWSKRHTVSMSHYKNWWIKNLWPHNCCCIVNIISESELRYPQSSSSIKCVVFSVLH